MVVVVVVCTVDYGLCVMMKDGNNHEEISWKNDSTRCFELSPWHAGNLLLAVVATWADSPSWSSRCP